MPMLDPTQDEINLSNFKIVDKVTLLGVEISWSLNNTTEIFTKIRDKIISLAAFWEPFRLSLLGRITVAKTFLLNYVAC
jgi:hypothetical protein